ncbi:class I SAM-dependent methyltransferase [Phormidium sp. CCY1219]|uniref:class I SAM-dependent methyltransferase n=1 Tax=Phormidium sp. CCY1219 TaxID=2886104 RepID=UPI002D1EBC41|nr:class I SAM-dependent methyltransferase [Phormidium sp. CCY1219]MEB3826743.1 class I SAM-dependent methyltransferase [Phormidium sp. CCY1219]
MKKSRNFLKFIALFFSLLVLGVMLNGCGTDMKTAAESGTIYQHKTIPSSDGIGKIYMGREIAKVMGHRGAAWLERDSREREEKPSLLREALELKRTDIVADIGAGTGYISFQMSEMVPEGKVLAVDIQPEMLDILEGLKKEKQITNVETILGSETNPNLPESTIDLGIMVDAYHEFNYPREMMEGIVKALKPDGRVVLVEYRGENPLLMIKRLHKMTQKQVKKEMEAVGLQWRGTKEMLPKQHVMIFEKQA